MTIRARIFLSMFLLVGVGMYYLTDWVLEDLRPRYLESMEESMVDTSTLLSVMFTNSVMHGVVNPEVFRSSFDEVSKREIDAQIYDLVKTNVDLRVYVTDTEGIVVFDSDGGQAEGEDYSQWNDVRRTLGGQYGARSTRTNEDDPRTSILHVAAPLLVDGEIAGVLTVSKPIFSANKFIAMAQRKILIGAVIATGAVLILGLISTAWITRPIQQLTRYAQSVRDGKRAQLPAVGRTEIGVMGQALEEMREALEGKEYVEHYVQTLTHELKGPLSAISGAAELLEEDPPEDRRRRFLANIGTESERIRSIVDRLLLLTNLENRQGLQDVEPVDLVALATAVMSSLEPTAAARRVQIDRQVDPTCSVTVNGERFLLRHALTNLLQNALEFSPPGGTIQLNLAIREGESVFCVLDSGPGIPDYALPRIYERFYSLKRPDTGHKSSGVGLTLVREVAELHGGRAELTNRAEGGVQACLILPAT